MTSVCLVTGASSGIGRATAHLLAERGDVVALLARDRDALVVTEAECRTRGATGTLVLPCDVGDDAAVGRAVAEVLAAHGRLDLVVGSAGVVAYGRLEEVPADVFDAVMRTNVAGTANLARHVVPVLRRQGAGSLVVVGSVVGHAIVPRMGAYVVSKWALRALVQQIQVENRDVRGVHIGYVAPGSVDTPIYDLAAQYTGFAGRPPEPVVSPEKLAQVVLRAAGRRRPRIQYPASNHLIRLGFAVTPRLADALVGPLFDVLALDRSHPTPGSPGNVLAARPGHAVRGRHGSGLTALVRDVRTRWNLRRSRSEGASASAAPGAVGPAGAAER